MLAKLLRLLCCVPQKYNFDEIDLDKDGKITLNEFNEFMIKEKGHPPTIEQWLRYHLADTHHDGKISRQEFQNILLIKTNQL